MAEQWTADKVLRLSSSFQSSCVLAAAADLDLFTVLGRRRMTAQAMAAELGTDARATAALMDALAALEVLVKEGDEYHVPGGLAGFVTEGGPRSVLAMVRHHANCLRSWVQLTRVVQSGEPARREPSVRGAEADQAAFIGAMHDISGPMAASLIREIRPLEFRHLLDVGGASGTWTIAFLQAVPGSTATLFDLPEVVPLARRRIGDAGLADRVDLVAGDFYRDPLPSGADLVWLSAIIHQNSREENRALFAKAHEAVSGGGSVVIRDVVVDSTRTRPVRGALFAINMLVATPGGGTYTFDEIREDLLAAGFKNPTLLRQGEFMDSLVRATKRR